MHRFWGSVVACVILTWHPWVVAEVVGNLYQQEVLVASQKASERRRAASTALQSVLVRVSGVPRVVAAEPVREALQQAEKLLEAYHYESTDKLLEREGVEVVASRLVLKFSRRSVERVLRQAQLPLWPANRPTVLVWLVKDDIREGRQLVSLQVPGDLTASVAEMVRRRGLPVVSPLLDLQDQLSISADQVWHLENEAIVAASARYQVDAIVVGRYSQTSSGQWLATWTLLHKDQQEVFDGQNDAESSLVVAGLEVVANHLAQLYGVVASSMFSDALVMELQRVEDFSDYVEVTRYLEGLAMVRQLELTSVQGNSLWFYLHAEGDVSRLMDTLALDHKLLRSEQPLTDEGVVTLPQVSPAVLGSVGNPLRFRWPG